LGIDFNPDTDWNEREQVFKMSGQIVNTSNVTQSAEGNKDGMWTTVISCAILLP
jgi:arginine decarboxylase